MDILRYSELKAKKKVRIEKVKDEILIIAERWDEPTGEKMESEIIPAERYETEFEQSSRHLAAVKNNHDALQELISDVEKFKGGKDVR